MHAGFPQPVRDYLRTMPLRTGIVWAHNGEPMIIVKLPTGTSIASAVISVDKIRRDGLTPSKLHVHLLLQEKHHAPIGVDCLVNPPRLPDAQAMQALSTVKQIEVYAITSDLGYLGTRWVSWSTKKRRQIRTSLRASMDSPTPASSPAVSPPSPYEPASAPSLLYDPYRATLSRLHERELAQIQEIAQQDEQAATIFSTQAQVTHSLEEQALAYAHQTKLASRKLLQLQTLHEWEWIRKAIFPNYPLWVECTQPFPFYHRKEFAILCFRTTQGHRPLHASEDGTAYYRTYLQAGRWHLHFIDVAGEEFLRLMTSNVTYTETEWIIDPLHFCPLQNCKVSGIPPSSRRATPILCATCQQETAFWMQWSNALLACVLNTSFSSRQRYVSVHQESPSASSKPSQAPKKPLNSIQRPQSSDHLQPEVRTKTSSPEAPAISIPASPSPLVQSTSPVQKVPRPIIVKHALLIDRYIREQKTSEQQTMVEQAQKYLWLHSAWFMTEALRSNDTSFDMLRLPATNLYIELEQPRMLHGLNFAACAFLRVSDATRAPQQWQCTLLDQEGKSTWVLFYELNADLRRGTWTVPKYHACPEQQCLIEEGEGERVFTLCSSCQERITALTTWIATALRMLSGDFQEQVELREPEEVLEPSVKVEKDAATGESKEKPILHRFRVFRYYDACVHRGTAPQTRRGSWMTGRPLAESLYDVHPDAIIYVQIQPHEHERTYRHDRYTYMKGKSQHIDPRPRLQPMTIAHFHQLPRAQKITKVAASKYDERANS